VVTDAPAVPVQPVPVVRKAPPKKVEEHPIDFGEVLLDDLLSDFFSGNPAPVPTRPAPTKKRNKSVTDGQVSLF
jgi:hypothetical protein